MTSSRTIVVPTTLGVAVVSSLTLLRPHGLLAAPPAVAAWLAVWVAICVQALPFLGLGVLVSGAVAAFGSPDRVRRLVPREPVAAVWAAGLSGAVLPGCECASVPVAQSLMRRGVPSGPAFTFMLASPAVNPVVLVATAVAYPGQPMMVVARLVAALGTAWTVGWLWLRYGQDHWIRRPATQPVSHERPGEVFRRTAVHDLLHAGGYLVLGAGLAATVTVLLPAGWLAHLAKSALAAVLVMAVLAVVVSVCSEADAFVAASFTAVSPTAQLVFLTVSPMVDLKLVSLQMGTFGPALAARLAPTTFLVAVLVAGAVGAVTL